MIRIVFFIASLVLMVFTGSPASFAMVILDERFTGTAGVDPARTTAMVDTERHCVLLSWRSLAGAIDVMDNGIGYATASKAGVTLYELDDATGRMAPNPAFSCPWVTDATGVSIRQDNLSVWAITGDSIAFYKFDGAGMSSDPALKVSGLVNTLSVAAFEEADSALLLQGEAGRAVITRYDAGAEPGHGLVFRPGIEDPVSVSVVGRSMDFRLFTEEAAYYYSYDDAGGSYVEDPVKKITGLAGVVSADSNGTGNSVLTGIDLGFYTSLDSGGAARVDVYSPGPVEQPVAVSLKAGTKEQVFLNENGIVQWWTYDDAAGRMVRDPDLEISGLDLNRGYSRPGLYYSAVLNTPEIYDAARLTAAEVKPEGTSVSYFVSSDGGVAFTAVSPGRWTAIPAGCSFVLMAELDTADPRQTPKIFNVVLEVEEDIVLEGYIDPYPAERDRNVTIKAGAVSLSSGSPAMLDSCSVRYPLEVKADGGPALPEGEMPAVAAMLYNPAAGLWEYTFTVPGKTVGGRWPDDGTYLVEITGTQGGTRKMLTLNLEVSGNILGRLIIRTLNW